MDQCFLFGGGSVGPPSTMLGQNWTSGVTDPDIVYVIGREDDGLRPLYMF